MDINDFKDHLTDLPPEKRKLFVELLQVKKIERGPITPRKISWTL
jgi:hypothetical protein